MNCRDVMLTLIYSCREQDTVAECSELMRDEKIGFVPILNERGEIAGVITDRDIVVRVIAEGKPVTTPIRDVMSVGTLLTCQPDEDLRVLEERMGKQQKTRAVVLDETGKLVGIISLSDIAGVEPSAVRTGTLLKEIFRRQSATLARS